MDTISISGAYWTDGIFYIAANWSSSGLGVGKTGQTVLSPPILQGLTGTISSGGTSLTVSPNTNGMKVGDIILIGDSSNVEELVVINVVDSSTLTVETTAMKTGMSPTGAWNAHAGDNLIVTTTLDESTRVTVTNFQYNFGGALYCTGQVDMQGGPNFFGAILAEQGYAAGGNPEIWFDYNLTKCDLTKYGIPTVVKGAWREVY